MWRLVPKIKVKPAFMTQAPLSPAPHASLDRLRKRSSRDPVQICSLANDSLGKCPTPALILRDRQGVDTLRLQVASCHGRRHAYTTRLCMLRTDSVRSRYVSSPARDFDLR